MLLVRFDKWTRKTVNKHTNSYTQTINEHYINIIMFGFVWKAIKWNEYIDHFHSE